MTIRYSDVNVGDRIPSLTKPAFSKLQLALFAGAAADHNPIHVDEDAAKGGGLPGIIAHGMLTMAFLGELLTDWAPQKSLRSFSARFTAIAMLEDSITCTGVVTAKREEGGEKLIDLELAAENQKGEKVQVGKATVALS